jgi:large subunit ribosomal protein L6
MGTKELKIIEYPQTVSIDTLSTGKDLSLAFTGPLGKTSLSFPEGFSIENNPEERVLTLKCSLPSPKLMQRLMGTFSSLMKQKIEGVSQGFKKQLNLVGVGYRANVKDNNLSLRLGYSHEINVTFDEDLEIICPNQTTIFIRGIDLVKVTQKAAEIRSWRLPEPYKGKGIFYKGETVRRKEGKKN